MVALRRRDRVNALMKIAAVLGLVVALGTVGVVSWLKLAPRHTPAAQAPLARLDDPSLKDFRAAFNARSARARILVLLSPT